jgi:hypothetical protein
MEKAFSKPHLGAFFASQKTGLCGGSAACAADGHLRWPRPFNPLRASTHPKGVDNPSDRQLSRRFLIDTF